MEFNLSEEQALLQQSTRELLDKESPIEEARGVMEDNPEGYSKALYAQLAELGYLGLLLPEDQDGADMGHLGLVAVLEEMGRAAYPGPYLDAVLGLEVLRRNRDSEATSWLARAVSGEALVTVAARETLGLEDGSAPTAQFKSGKVTGTKCLIPYGGSADALVVTTAQGLALVPRPDAGWNATSLGTMDHAQRLVEIQFDSAATLIADSAAAAPILEAVERTSALGSAALLVGLMARALEMAHAYMMEREAFGTVIASFQALQHRAADMFLRTEAARTTVQRAAWAQDSGQDNARMLVAASKVYAIEAANLVCRENIQMHGGVGYTWEYDPHIYLKRVKTLEQLYGTSRDLIEVVLEEHGI